MIILLLDRRALSFMAADTGPIRVELIRPPPSPPSSSSSSPSSSSSIRWPFYRVLPSFTEFFRPLLTRRLCYCSFPLLLVLAFFFVHSFFRFFFCFSFSFLLLSFPFARIVQWKPRTPSGVFRFAQRAVASGRGRVLPSFTEFFFS